MKLSDYVVSFFEDLGLGHVFMLPGGGCMHLVDSFGSSGRIRFVAMLHEQAVAIAADGYSQYTGGLGLALVTTGPGGTNAVTGVAGSWADSIPVVCLSGQVKRADLLTGRGVRMMGPQEVPIVDIVRPITKYAVTITDPGQVRYHLERAVWEARSGRPGPVWLDFPLDVQAADIEPAALPGFAAPARPPVDVEAARRLVELLRGSRRPVFLLGNGVRLAGAADRARSVVERLGVPALLTWKTLDLLPDDHPLFAGRPGGVGQRGANFTQQTADLIVVIGARLDLPSVAFNPGHFAPHAQRVIVDADPAEIRKLGWTGHLEVVGDAGDFIDALDGALADAPKHAWGPWCAQVQRWRLQYPVVPPELWRQVGSVNNYVLVETLSRVLTADDLLVPGSSGACSEITMQAYRPREGQRVFNTEGLGPMGFGIAAAIGGAIASGRRTVCVDGDGGFVMNVQELETVRRLNLPIKFFVLDNDGYGSIRATQRNYFNGRFVASEPGSGLTLPNYRELCPAFGIPTESIEDHTDLEARVRAFLGRPGPGVCVVRISVDQSTSPRASSRQLPDGTMVTAPMEDLAPFLDRAEFEAAMRIADEGAS